MKVWCFWMALTICCMTLMPIFVARSLLSRSWPAPLPLQHRRMSQHVGQSRRSTSLGRGE